jgi:hypothetical protein
MLLHPFPTIERYHQLLSLPSPLYEANTSKLHSKESPRCHGMSFALVRQLHALGTSMQIQVPTSMQLVVICTIVSLPSVSF